MVKNYNSAAFDPTQRDAVGGEDNISIDLITLHCESEKHTEIQNPFNIPGRQKKSVRRGHVALYMGALAS
ncbi:MAG: hypothetical protein JSW25_08315 [Thermoplasmata archaeon]|nr:MAG: hypothetical protein JSW25_08315 [Thermoplasmata archaeon]